VDRVVEGDVEAELGAQLVDEPGFDECVGRGINAELTLQGGVRVAARGGVGD
jgi:hypothetical protein